MGSRAGITILVSSILLLVGCAQPKLTYTALPDQGAEGAGFPFVIPRTVVKVTPMADKHGATENVTFTTVPVPYKPDGKSQLSAFLATDSSSSGWSLTPTTVSSVTYVDDLVIGAIGTHLTDNRKDAIDAIVGLAALVGVFAAESDCATGNVPLQPFVIDAFGTSGGKVPNTKCWGYELTAADFTPVSMKAYPVSELRNVGSVAWFPIPVCKAHKVRVFRCGDDNCTSERKDLPSYSTVLSLSDGMQYHRVALPLKGKVTLHPDFCLADISNEGVASSNWGALKQLVSDVKAEKEKKK